MDTIRLYMPLCNQEIMLPGKLPIISSGASHRDVSCISCKIHNDVSWNLPKKVYHIVTDNFVNLLHISQAQLYSIFRKEDSHLQF